MISFVEYTPIKGYSGKYLCGITVVNRESLDLVKQKILRRVDSYHYRRNSFLYNEIVEETKEELDNIKTVKALKDYIKYWDKYGIFDYILTFKYIDGYYCMVEPIG